ncbi:recombinase family protein [Isoptericola sp. NEAU-Y5]|uniref:Recombinase family protein n=1 Tax=Isoptericola luteus TaxID=2879484 RepID=A0ABS7ZA92_9MICO|nr:recombinase family protein [Isoptericola sp. NEAU-Y5]MCA5891978.1 recombinase family protein [Isoptericola sp. NEAU-Y5]
MTTDAPTPGRCCALYVRRSSAAKTGNRTLAEQEAEARALATRESLHVVEVYAEREGTGASARSGKKRPQWEAALAALDKGDRFRTVIAYALDRADRRGADTLGNMLTKHAATGRRVLTCDGVDTSDEKQRMTTIIRGEVARDYSERLGDNIARTKRYRREEGRWLGGRPPWGLRVESVPDPVTGDPVKTGRLVHDPVTYPEARKAAEALLAGASLWSVVNDLNARQVTPLASGVEWGARVTRKARNGPEDVVSAPQGWRVPSLANLVRQPSWAGLQGIRHRKRDGDGKLLPWPAVAEVYRSTETGEPVSIGEGVVTPEERLLILAHLDARTAEAVGAVPTVQGRPRRHVANQPTSLLGTRLVCSSCGSRCVVNNAKKKDGTRYRYYRCSSAAQGGSRCPGFSAPLLDLDDYVGWRVRSYIASLTPEDDALWAASAVWAATEDPATRDALKSAEAALNAARANLERIRRLVAAGVFLEEDAAVEMPRARKAVEVAERDVADAGGGTPDVGALLDAAGTEDAWEALDTLARRRVIESVVERVTVTRAGRRGVRFSPERVTVTWAHTSAPIDADSTGAPSPVSDRPWGEKRRGGLKR